MEAKAPATKKNLIDLDQKVFCCRRVPIFVSESAPPLCSRVSNRKPGKILRLEMRHLGFDRRKNIFCLTDIDTLAQATVPRAIEKVNAKTDDEPDDEPNPRFKR